MMERTWNGEKRMGIPQLKQTEMMVHRWQDLRLRHRMKMEKLWKKNVFW